jgi:hypothetical protein
MSQTEIKAPKPFFILSFSYTFEQVEEDQLGTGVYFAYARPYTFS